MIESVKIQNVRGFDEITVKDLRQFNIIVGPNASGKTALLESIYLASGGPNISFKMKAWRGMGDRIELRSDPKVLADLWADLFHQNSKSAGVSLGGSDDIARSLEISLEETETVILATGSALEDVGPEVPIAFQWFKDGRPISNKIRPRIEANRLKFEGVPAVLGSAFYSSAAQISVGETTNWFSLLSKKKEAGPIIETMKNIFPLINDLDVQTHNGVAMIHADLDALSEKLPLGLVSNGINKLMAILLAIPYERVVMMDEIENGFHYEIMPDIWKALHESAKHYDSQIFAVTHSLECLRAAIPVIEKNEKEFCLLRAKREHGKCKMEQFEGKSFRAVLSRGGEFRKP